MKYTCIALLLLLSSCYTPKKAERQMLKAKAHYPEMVAGNCADWYPPVDSIDTKIVYKPGAPLPPRIDTVTVDCDSAKGIVKLPCPPCQQKAPDTVETTKFIQVVNNARVDQQAMELDRQAKQIAVLEDDKAELKKSRNLFILFTSILGLYLVLKILAMFVPAMKWAKILP